MSVDFFDCHNCEESVCDCGDYESCQCDMRWCSMECAEKEGYKRQSCSKYKDMDECEKDCWGCEYVIEESCNFCRKDDYEDYHMTRYLLEKMGVSRSEIIAEMRESGW